LLPDRILPSVDLVGSATPNYSLAELDIEQMRFMEIPKSGNLLSYWKSGASPSAKEMIEITNGQSHADQLDSHAVTRGEVEIDGEALAKLNVEFGYSVKTSFIFEEEKAGSGGSPESAVNARPFLLGGLLELNADGSERRFLMDYRESENAEPGAPSLFWHLGAEHVGDTKATLPGPSGRPAESIEAIPLSGTPGPSLASFMAGWASGTQIARGLSTPSADDADVSTVAEIAIYAPSNPEAELFTVDTVLPDAQADLVRLQNAELAIVPTYVVGAAPATASTQPRVEDRPDFGLIVQVVGLDVFPEDVSFTPSSANRLLEQLPWVDSGCGLAASNLELEGIQPDAVDVGDGAQAADRAQGSAIPTDAAFAFGEQLDGLLKQSDKGAVMVIVLALMALTTGRFASRPPGPP
jgi:hypothetical protein